jgi:succinate dehydrogenase/fumarate reductase flavoprotein subunit
MACVPHNYLLGALTYGKLSAQHALQYIEDWAPSGDLADQIARERTRVQAPLTRPNGIPHHQYEYKVRRLVNDYLQPPKSANRMQAGLAHFMRALDELEEVGASSPHDVMRVMEGHFIRDCAEMAARASLYRTESRWGLYHYRVDFPETDDANWFCHTQLYKDADGRMACKKRPVAPYVVPLDASERDAYHHLRVKSPAPTPASAAE